MLRGVRLQGELMSVRFLTAFCAAIGAASLGAVAAQTTRAAGDGVYTAAQAARGEAIYKDKCAVCHGATLGGAQAPPLAGSDFARVWAGPLSDLVDKVQNTMPANDPGTLTRQQSADIVAHLLQVGKFVAGRAELAPDETTLKLITLPRPPGPPAAPAAAPGAASFPAAGNLAQVMRGILFPNSNLLFNVQTHDPAAPVPPRPSVSGRPTGGFNWADWGAGIYSGWELVDYAAVAIAESAPMMLTPGRRCENGKAVPVAEPEWIKFTIEMAEAGKAAYKASQTRKQEAVSEVTDQIATSCLHCHEVYRDKPAIRTSPDPSNKAARCVK